MNNINTIYYPQSKLNPPPTAIEHIQQGLWIGRIPFLILKRKDHPNIAPLAIITKNTFTTGPYILTQTPGTATFCTPIGTCTITIAPDNSEHKNYKPKPALTKKQIEIINQVNEPPLHTP